MPTRGDEAPASPNVGRLISSDSVPVGGFTPGAILAGRYRIVGLLGRGGMGEVYRADDLKLGQPVALKFLPKKFGSDPVRRERFFAKRFAASLKLEQRRPLTRSPDSDTIATFVYKVNTMPSTVVSLRVSNEQAERLQRKARKLGRSASETGAILLDESLRRDEFAFIDFRDSAVGRQAYIQGSRLAAWQAVSIVRDYDGNVIKAAGHLEWPAVKILAALNYAAAFPDEIENAIRDNQAQTLDSISRMLPHVEEFRASAKARKKK